MTPRPKSPAGHNLAEMNRRLRVAQTGEIAPRCVRRYRLTYARPKQVDPRIVCLNKYNTRTKKWLPAAVTGLHRNCFRCWLSILT